MINNSIRIITDSSCDLSKKNLKKYSIDCQPLIVIIDDKEYRDIDIEDIIQWSYDNQKTPKTATVSEAEIYEILKRSIDNSIPTIFLTISSHASSYNSMVNAVVKKHNLENLIRVIDSKTLSLGLGNLCINAREYANMGLSIDEIESRLLNDIDRAKTTFVIDHVDFLKYGGRCSSLTSLVATMFQFKPLIEMIDGKLKVIKKYRGHHLSTIKRYTTELLENIEDYEDKRLLIAHSCSFSDIKEVLKIIRSKNYFKEIIVQKGGPVVVTHAGDDSIGIFVIKKSAN